MTYQTYQIKSDDLYFLLGEKEYSFYVPPDWSVSEKQKKKEDFIRRNQKKGYINESGIPTEELERLLSLIRNCVYCVLRDNTGPFGFPYTAAFFGSEEGAVIGHWKINDKFQMEIVAPEKREAVFRETFSLDKLPPVQGEPLRIDLSSDEGEILIGAWENHDNIVLQQFAQRFDTTPEQITELLDDIKKKETSFCVMRSTEPGEIAFAVYPKRAAAMRFTAYPNSGASMTCFERIRLPENAEEYIFDFREDQTE